MIPQIAQLVIIFPGNQRDILIRQDTTEAVVTVFAQITVPLPETTPTGEQQDTLLVAQVIEGL